jgi:hypothetical protein
MKNTGIPPTCLLYTVCVLTKAHTHIHVRTHIHRHRHKRTKTSTHTAHLLVGYKLLCAAGPQTLHVQAAHSHAGSNKTRPYLGAPRHTSSALPHTHTHTQMHFLCMGVYTCQPHHPLNHPRSSHQLNHTSFAVDYIF